jgi:hypothetical protein
MHTEDTIESGSERAIEESIRREWKGFCVFGRGLLSGCDCGSAWESGCRCLFFGEGVPDWLVWRPSERILSRYWRCIAF